MKDAKTAKTAIKTLIPFILVALMMSCSDRFSDNDLELISLSMGPRDARHIQWTSTEVRYLDESKLDTDDVETFYTRVFKFDKKRFESISNSILSSDLVELQEEKLGNIHGRWVCMELHYTNGKVKKWERIDPSSKDYIKFDSLLNYRGDFLRNESGYFEIYSAKCGRVPAPPYIQDPAEIKVPVDSTNF